MHGTAGALGLRKIGWVGPHTTQTLGNVLTIADSYGPFQSMPSNNSQLSVVVLVLPCTPSQPLETTTASHRSHSLTRRAGSLLALGFTSRMNDLVELYNKEGGG